MGRNHFLTEKNFNRLKIEIEKSRKEHPESEIIFSSDDDEINRQVLEKAKINILLLPLSKRKDFSKQRNSGLNTVLVNIAKKNNVEIGIDLEELFSQEKKQKAEILSRITQNINLCKKGKVQIKFISKNKKVDPYLLKSLGLVLGMPTWMIKNI